MFTSKSYLIEHAGWLLACNAPSNIAKGERKLAALSPDDKMAAQDHARHLVALYSGQSANAAATYAGHDYAEGKTQ